MMDKQFWEDYANNADSNYNEEFAKFISNLAVSLKCTSVLEVGCNAGNDLKLFPEQIEVHGVDSNENIINKAKERLPSFNFKIGSVTELPYEETSIDLIFTHGFFNYLEDESVSKGIEELFRVSKKYIVNCEMLGEDNIIDAKTSRKGRNMYKKWLEYEVRIISNVEMHEDFEPEQPRFVLVKKI